MRHLKTAWRALSMASFGLRYLAATHVPGISKAWIRLRHITGRGREHAGKSAVDYFQGVLRDYENVARLAGLTASDSIFAGRTVLELGPGDTLSVGLLAQARGATKFEVLDPFEYLGESARMPLTYLDLFEREGREFHDRELERTLRSIPAHRSLAELEQSGRRFDLVISRAVLEHVGDLDQLFSALSQVVREDGMLIHKVDLRCHGYKFDHALDFLSFPEPLYRRWTAPLGLPNRLRLGAYLRSAYYHNLPVIYAASTHRLSAAEVTAARAQLAAPFRALSIDELAILGMWLVQVGPRHPLAERNMREWSRALALPQAPAELLAPF